MAHITILGLGPGEWKHLTQEAVAVLHAHDEMWLRTQHHPVVRELPDHLTVHTFDALYEQADHFDEVYGRIAAEVVRLGQRPQGVLYAVPGHPAVGETTVPRIRAAARAAGVRLRLVAGLSFIEPSLTAVDADALDGLQIADATALAAQHYPRLDAARPALVAQLYSRLVASDVKLTLLELYPAEHPVTVLHAAGTGAARALTMPLYRLDQTDEFAYLTSLWVPPLDQPSALPELQAVVAHLRAPDGCPWDREQTHETLRDAVLEEAYEVVDAIERGAAGELCDELGDLLLMVTMHAQIAHEGGDFGMADVIASITHKLVRRHPHVFGEVVVDGTGQVLRNWEAIKAQERAQKGETEADGFAEVPLALPALVRARKIAKKARQQGWTAPDPAAAFNAWQREGSDEALGDLLLALAARGGERGQAAETLLREATARLVAARRMEKGE